MLSTIIIAVSVSRVRQYASHTQCVCRVHWVKKTTAERVWSPKCYWSNSTKSDTRLYKNEILTHYDLYRWFVEYMICDCRKLSTMKKEKRETQNRSITYYTTQYYRNSIPLPAHREMVRMFYLFFFFAENAALQRCNWLFLLIEAICYCNNHLDCRRRSRRVLGLFLCV